MNTAATVREPAYTESAFTTALPIVGRLLIAAIFLLSGLAKITDPAGTIGYIQSAELPFAKGAYVAAVTIEVIGGALLILGYRAKLVASVLAAFTVVAAFGFHFDLADQNQFIHFFKNLAMAGGLLQVVALSARSAD